MKFITLFLFLNIYLSIAFAGGAVGNGGGFAKCLDDQYYSYDYLLSIDHSFGKDNDLNLKQQLDFISTQLKRLEEPFAEEFNDFISTLFTQKPGNKFQWSKRSSLPLMWEPDLDASLPGNCKNRNQAIYFFSAMPGYDFISYAYDVELIKLVQAQLNGDMQISYLVVHEWLWNHYGREQFMELAVFNRLLHSENLKNLTQSEYKKYRDFEF